MADVIDGLSNTVLLVENAGRQQVFLRGQAVMPNTPPDLLQDGPSMALGPITTPTIAFAKF